jgi:hypothetical protein
VGGDRALLAAEEAIARAHSASGAAHVYGGEEEASATAAAASAATGGKLPLGSPTAAGARGARGGFEAAGAVLDLENVLSPGLGVEVPAMFLDPTLVQSMKAGVTVGNLTSVGAPYPPSIPAVVAQLPPPASLLHLTASQPSASCTLALCSVATPGRHGLQLLLGAAQARRELCARTAAALGCMCACVCRCVARARGQFMGMIEFLSAGLLHQYKSLFPHGKQERGTGGRSPLLGPTPASPGIHRRGSERELRDSNGASLSPMLSGGGGGGGGGLAGMMTPSGTGLRLKAKVSGPPVPDVDAKFKAGAFGPRCEHARVLLMHARGEGWVGGGAAAVCGVAMCVRV